MQQIIRDWSELEICTRTELVEQLVLHYQESRNAAKSSGIGNSTTKFILVKLEKDPNWTLSDIFTLLEGVSQHVNPARSTSFKSMRDRAVALCQTSHDLVRALKFVPKWDLPLHFELAVSLSKDKAELASIVRKYYL